MNLLKFPHTEILFENYDDELILLDLSRGIYYTINRSGADCLLILLSASTTEDAELLISQRFEAPDNNIAFSIVSMIEQLSGFGVVIPRGENEAGLACEIAPGSGIVFTPPLVEQYKDIEDILKFDPVHDVTDGGWPSIREKPAL